MNTGKISQTIVLTLLMLCVLPTLAITSDICDLSSSVRINGMGQTGVAVTDGLAACFNPAQIAYPMHTYKVYFSSSPGSYAFYKPGSDFYARSSSNLENYKVLASVYNNCNNRESGFCVNAGFEYLNEEYRLIDSNYVDPYRSIPESKESLYRASIGFGLKSQTNVSCGLNLNWFKPDSASDYGHSADLGFLIGLPSIYTKTDKIRAGQTEFNIYPSFGLSVQKMFLESTSQIIPDKDAELVTRLGTSIKFSWESNYGARKSSRCYIITTLESNSQKDKTIQLGLEIGLYDAVQLRYGHRGYNRDTNWNAFGYSISSLGVIRHLWHDYGGQSSNLRHLLTNRIDLRLEYAHNEYSSWNSGINYYAISLTVY